MDAGLGRVLQIRTVLNIAIVQRMIVDEDVPGGAAAYIFNKVMEEQGGYKWLDVAPRTITGQAHRPAYSTDGDYFSKPNEEQVIDMVRRMMADITCSA